MGWTETEIRQLKRLASSNRLFMSEIAAELGKPSQVTRYMARRLGVRSNPPGRMGAWNAKHKHLREVALRYFQTHSFDETAERFGLNSSELKSLMSVTYRDPKFKHLRKDLRRHDAWTHKETLFLLRHAGLQPRRWIARQLKRGRMHAVKEQLTRLRIQSRFLNGMPRKWLLEILGPHRCPEGIKTAAGPTGCPRRGADFRFVIVPWIECDDLLRRYPDAFDHQTSAAIRCMSSFQRWIHGVQTKRGIYRRFRRIVEGYPYGK